MRVHFRWADLCWGIGLLCWAVGLLCWPQVAVLSGYEGLSLCFRTLIPSLFPFFVLSSLTIRLNLLRSPAQRLGRWMGPIFGLSEACAPPLLLGLIGGYPIGARSTGQLYQAGYCSKEEAQRLLLFCNNAGPAFFLGFVGGGIFHSVPIGLILWLCHILSALLIGVGARVLLPAPARSHSPSLNDSTAHESTIFIWVDSIRESFSTILTISAFVTIFAVILGLLDCSRFFSLFLGKLTDSALWDQWLRCFLRGLVELTNGLSVLPDSPKLLSLPLVSFLLGWGGICVHCQTVSVLNGTGLSLKGYLPAKLIQGLLAAGLTCMIYFCFPSAITTFASCQHSLTSTSLRTLSCSILLCICLYFSFLLLKIHFKGRNHRKIRL